MKKVSLLLGIICIFVFVGCGQEEKAERPAQEKTKETVEGVKEKAGKTVEGLKEKTGKAVEEAKEEAGETVDATKEKAEAAAKRVKEKIGEAAEGIKAKVGAVGVIKMKNEKAFSQHRMGIVEFDHKSHVDKYGLGCGKCHHDENHKPLNNLSYEDSVAGCFECHDKTGKPRRDQSMSQQEWEKEQIKYYYGAIHENCMGCHKETEGPVSCMECHPSPNKR